MDNQPKIEKVKNQNLENCLKELSLNIMNNNSQKGDLRSKILSFASQLIPNSQGGS